MREKEDYVKFLKTMTKNEILWFIRGNLIKDGEKLRFNMSGGDGTGDGIIKGSCTVHNQKVLNTFAYLGIYDYTHSLFLDFHKGGSSIFLKYWGKEDVIDEDDFTNGYSTSEIIFKIFELTIFSNRTTRRRNI
jgi:hypothetical protein